MGEGSCEPIKYLINTDRVEKCEIKKIESILDQSEIITSQEKLSIIIEPSSLYEKNLARIPKPPQVSEVTMQTEINE